MTMTAFPSQATDARLRAVLERLPRFNRSAILGVGAISGLAAITLILTILLGNLGAALDSAGRQGMYSQKMAKTVGGLIMATDTDKAAAKAAVEDLRQTATAFEKTVAHFEQMGGAIAQRAVAVRAVWTPFHAAVNRAIAGGDALGPAIEVVDHTNLGLLARSQELTTALAAKVKVYERLRPAANEGDQVPAPPVTPVASPQAARRSPPVSRTGGRDEWEDF